MSTFMLLFLITIVSQRILRAHCGQSTVYALCTFICNYCPIISDMDRHVSLACTFCLRTKEKLECTWVGTAV